MRAAVEHEVRQQSIIDHVISLVVNEVRRLASTSRGRVISVRASKLSRLMSGGVSKTVARSLIREVLEVLCEKVSCSKLSTGRGVVYVFERRSVLNVPANVLMLMCREEM